MKVVRHDLLDRKNAISAALIQLSMELDFYSISAFFDQDWFKRLWIVQEFALASRIEIHNGFDFLSPEQISLGLAPLALLQLHPHIPLLDLGNLGDCFTIVLLRLSYSGERSRVNLLPAVSSHHGRLCQLDQDRIYGLLALSSTMTGPDFEIEYGTSVESVYI
jgi:hypothetical protein